MAGGLTKGIGVFFVILGTLLLLGGMAAAGFGLYAGSQEQEKGLFADPQPRDEAEVLMLGGAVAAGAGIVALILGAILIGIGAGMARRELLMAIQHGQRGAPGGEATPAPAPTTPRRRGLVVAALVIAAVLTVGTLAALSTRGAPARDVASASTSPAQLASGESATQTFSGHVQGARGPLVGGLNTAAAVHTIDAAPGTYHIAGLLNWSADGPTGASSLVASFWNRETVTRGSMSRVAKVARASRQRRSMRPSARGFARASSWAGTAPPTRITRWRSRRSGRREPAGRGEKPSSTAIIAWSRERDPDYLAPRTGDGDLTGRVPLISQP